MAECKEKLVSVIVPVRNEETYIEECLLSVSRQKGRQFDYEILVVDDGSTDRTLPIVRKMISQNKRIHLFEGPGKGVSAARNLGLEHASGEYILFVDADDRLHSDTVIDSLVARAEETQADLLIGGMNSFHKFGNHVLAVTEKLSRMNNIDMFCPDLYRTMMISAKLYRRSMIEACHIRFLPIAYSEDAAFYMDCVFSASLIAGAGKDGKPLIVYDYRRRSFLENPSVTQNFKLSHWRDFTESNAYILDRMQKETEAMPASKSTKAQEYIQGFQVRILENTVRGFWRNYWNCTEQMRIEIRESLTRIRDCLPKHLWEQAIVKNASDAYLGLGSEEISSPVAERLAAAIILKEEPDAEAVNWTLSSLYRQEMPSFVVLLAEEQKKQLNPEWLQKENLCFYEGGSCNFEETVCRADGSRISLHPDYVMELTHAVGFQTASLVKMLNQMLSTGKNADGIFANVTDCKGASVGLRARNKVRFMMRKATNGAIRLPGDFGRRSSEILMSRKAWEQYHAGTLPKRMLQSWDALLIYRREDA